MFFEFIGPLDAPETGVASSFEFSGDELRCADVKFLFPYEGAFHFRAMAPDAASQHVWEDLVADGQRVHAFAGRHGSEPEAYLRVLPLALPAAPEDPSAVLYSQVDVAEPELAEAAASPAAGAARAPPDLHKAEREGDGNAMQRIEDLTQRLRVRADQALNSDAAKNLRRRADEALNSDAAKNLRRKGEQATRTTVNALKGLWSAARRGIEEIKSNIDDGAALRTPTAREGEALAHLTRHLMAEVESGATRAEADRLVLDLWSALAPQEPFARSGAQWKRVGFSREDPTVDFEATGTLTMRALLYFAGKYPAKVTAILREQAPRTNNHYPVAIVANNVTLMVAEVLRLREYGFFGLRMPSWGMFDVESELEAFEVFGEVFCLLMRLLDARWKQRGAHRGQFAELIGAVRVDFEALLGMGARDLPHFLDLAMERQLMY